MDNSIAYRPFRTNIYFIPFTVAAGIASCMLLGVSISNANVIASIIISIYAALCIFLTKSVYDTTKIIIFFKSDGLYLINDRQIKYHYVKWENISYAYYARSYRGFTFVILSPDPIEEKQLTKIANKGANSSRICINNCIVFHIDPLQDTSQIKSLISENVSQI